MLRIETNKENNTFYRVRSLYLKHLTMYSTLGKQTLLKCHADITSGQLLLINIFITEAMFIYDDVYGSNKSCM